MADRTDALMAALGADAINDFQAVIQDPSTDVSAQDNKVFIAAFDEPRKPWAVDLLLRHPRLDLSRGDFADIIAAVTDPYFDDGYELYIYDTVAFPYLRDVVDHPSVSHRTVFEALYGHGGVKLLLQAVQHGFQVTADDLIALAGEDWRREHRRFSEILGSSRAATASRDGRVRLIKALATTNNRWGLRALIQGDDNPAEEYFPPYLAWDEYLDDDQADLLTRRYARHWDVYIIDRRQQYLRNKITLTSPDEAILGAEMAVRDHEGDATARRGLEEVLKLVADLAFANVYVAKKARDEVFSAEWEPVLPFVTEKIVEHLGAAGLGIIRPMFSDLVQEVRWSALRRTWVGSVLRSVERTRLERLAATGTDDDRSRARRRVEA